MPTARQLPRYGFAPLEDASRAGEGFAPLVPSQVVAVETFFASGGAVWPGEEQKVFAAVAARRREFATGRACARRALQGLGRLPSAIVSGPRGEPIWPDGVVGSITHCAGVYAAAVAETDSIIGIGIDVEPNGPLPAGVLDHVACEAERGQISAHQRRQPSAHWDRVLFSAKESVYKLWYPLSRSWLGFEDAHLELDARAGTFTVELLVSGAALRHRDLAIAGRWSVENGFVRTAAWSEATSTTIR